MRLTQLAAFLPFLLAACCPACSTAQSHVMEPATEEPTSVSASVDWLPFGITTFLAAELLDQPVAMYFWLDGCEACDRFDRTTLIDPLVVSMLNEKFVAIKVTSDDPRFDELSQRYTVPMYPSLVMMTPDGKRGLVRLDGWTDTIRTVVGLAVALQVYTNIRLQSSVDGILDVLPGPDGKRPHDDKPDGQSEDQAR